MKKTILNSLIIGLLLCSFNLSGQDMADSAAVNSNTTPVSDDDYIQEEPTNPTPVTDEVQVQEEPTGVTDPNVTVSPEDAERIEAENNERAERLREDEKAAKQSLRASKAELRAVKAEKRASKAEKRAEKAKKKAEKERRKMDRGR